MDTVINDSDIPAIKLKEGIDMRALLNNEGTTFEVNFDQIVPEKRSYDSNEIADYANFEVHGVHDEDVYNDAEPFQQMASKMEEIAINGMVKKRIIREGCGDVVPEKCKVYIDYNAYVEYNEDPFDSTYVRKKQHVFRLGEGEALIGLDIGVQTMKVNEKAQFIVQPAYAYGVMGCLDRVPENASILFEVELHKYVNSGATVTYDKLPEDRKKQFIEIYKHALARCENANDLVNTRRNYKAAIRDYNRAATELEYCQLADYDEQIQQQNLMLRLYTNLVVCYMKIDDVRKCCLNANKIFKMCKGTDMIVPLKVYYNNVRALMALNDLEMAEKRLRIAAGRDRDNSYLVRCLLDLNKLKEQRKERDSKLAKAIFKVDSSVEVVSDEFTQCIQDLCADLKQNSEALRYDLPAKLSQNEINVVKTECVKSGLFFVECKDKQKYAIAKATPAVPDSE